MNRTHFLFATAAAAACEPLAARFEDSPVPFTVRRSQTGDDGQVKWVGSKRQSRSAPASVPSEFDPWIQTQ